MMRNLMFSVLLGVLAIGASVRIGAQAQLPAPPDVKAPPADAKKTASGLASKVLKVGTGNVHPGPTSSVTVHYTGWTTDGKMFDSSVARNQPAHSRSTG